MSNRRRLLLVEDEPLLCDLIADYAETLPDLEFLGDARNGPDALDKIRRLKPDIAILDIRMPGMNGLELLNRIRADYPDMRIIIFTGTIDDNSLRQALDYRADGYIEKSHGLQELRKGISSVLAGKTYYSPGIARLVSTYQIGASA